MIKFTSSTGMVIYLRPASISCIQASHNTVTFSGQAYLCFSEGMPCGTRDDGLSLLDEVLRFFTINGVKS
jgi:hypothetical protein